MRAFDRGTAAQVPVGVVNVARWEQFGLSDELPFQAMWYSVPPGEQSPRDCHVEAELSVVVTGTAWVETSDGVVAVDAGSAFLLEGGEAHTVHNRCEQPLVVFSAYWLPASAASVAEVRSA